MYNGKMLLILSRISLALSLLAPLVVRKEMFFPFIGGKVFFFRTLIELSLAFFIANIIFSDNPKLLFQKLLLRLKHPIVISSAAFAAFFLLGAVFAQNPTQAFWSNFERGEGAFQILHYFIFFVLLVLLYDTPKRLRRILKLHVFVSVLVGLYALGQFLEARFLPLGTFKFLIGIVERSSGTLGNPSYLAAYLLLTLFILAWLFLNSQTRKEKIFLACIGLFHSFLILNTATRGAFLGFGASIAFFFVLRAICAKSKTIRLSAIVFLAAFALLAVGFLMTSDSPTWRELPLIGRSLDLEGALKDLRPRLWTWQSAVSAILERPILGWGPENFPFAFDKYYNPNHYGIESFFDRTHNIFLEYLISGGVLLLIAFLSIFSFYYRLVLKRQKGVWRDVLMAAPVAYFVQGFFLFDVLPIYLVLFLFLALVLNTENPPEEDAFKSPAYSLSAARMGFGLALLTALVVLVYFTAFLPLEKNLTLASAFRQNTFQDAFTRYVAAIEAPSPIGQEEAVSSFMKFSLNAVEGSLRSPVKPPLEIIKMIAEANNDFFARFGHLFTGVRNLYLIGGVNIRVGTSFSAPEYIEKGKKIYEQAVAYSPTRIEFIEILIQVANFEKNQEEFDRLLKTAKALRPDIDWERRLGLVRG